METPWRISAIGPKGLKSWNEESHVFETHQLWQVSGKHCEIGKEQETWCKLIRPGSSECYACMCVWFLKQIHTVLQCVVDKGVWIAEDARTLADCSIVPVCTITSCLFTDLKKQFIAWIKLYIACSVTWPSFNSIHPIVPVWDQRMPINRP